MKKLTSTLCKFFITVVVCLYCNVINASNIVHSGSYQNITWTVTDDDVLTISGQGAVPREYIDGDICIPICSLWSNYDCNTFIIEEGITEIPETIMLSSNPIKTVILPNSITKIPRIAFASLYELTDVVLGNAVTEIGPQAFCNCVNLQNINIPNSVRIIDENAFNYCMSLQHINIPEGVTRISNGAFGVTGLREIILPSTITSIGIEAFNCTYYLEKVVIPEKCDSIYFSAFSGDVGAGSTKTIDLYIHKNVKYIAPNALSTWRNLRSITVDPANKNYYSIDGILFSKNNELIKYPAFKNDITTYDIPNNINSIASGAFYFTQFLKTVNIPESVTGIGIEAFGISSITKTNIPSGVKEINPYVFFCDISELTVNNINPPAIFFNGFFEGRYNNCKIYVPAGSLDNYRNNSSWNKFTDIREYSTNLPSYTSVSTENIINVILNNSNNSSMDINNDGVVNVADIVSYTNYKTTGNIYSIIPQTVDLGLPSGRLWADKNVGAYTPIGLGKYFAWGETEERTIYTPENYIWKTDNNTQENIIPLEYQYTWKNNWNGEMTDVYGFPKEYDAAYHYLGDNWRTPNKAEIDELFDYCTYEYCTNNGVTGHKITGPNGNSIFLPLSDMIIGEHLQSTANFYTHYMGSTYFVYDTNATTAYAHGFHNSCTDFSFGEYGVMREYGITVRPIYRGNSENNFYINDFTMNSNSTKQVTINMESDDIYMLQFDINCSSNLSISNFTLNPLLTNHKIVTNNIGNNTTRVIIYSDNNIINVNDILTVDVTSNNNNNVQTINMSNIILTGASKCINLNNYTTVTIGSDTGGINNVLDNNSNVSPIYNINGIISDKSSAVQIINGKKYVKKI